MVGKVTHVIIATLGLKTVGGPLIGMESCLHGSGMHSVLEKIRNSRTQVRTQGTNIQAYSLSPGGFLYCKMVGGLVVSFRV